MNLKVDTERSLKKWNPILEALKVKSDNLSKREIMATYAEYHMINEHIQYSTTAGHGMGSVSQESWVDKIERRNPFVNYPSKNREFNHNNMMENWKKYPGWSSMVGSGEIGQNLLPISMKILSRINNKHVILFSSPRMELVYPKTNESYTKMVGDIEIVKSYTLKEIEEIERIEFENNPERPKEFMEIVEPELIDQLIDNINNSGCNVILIYLLVQSIYIFPNKDLPETYDFVIRSRYSEWNDPDYEINFSE